MSKKDIVSKLNALRQNLLFTKLKSSKTADGSVKLSSEIRKIKYEMSILLSAYNKAMSLNNK